MDALIEGLLKYAQAGRTVEEAVPVNLSTLLAQVVDLLAPPLQLQVRFLPSLSDFNLKVFSLRQVLSNLIGNAIKYHDKPDGWIEILVKDRGKYLQFTVKDNGPGIAEQHHQKIFGIFQTFSSADDRKGTGIGLAIIKKIVEGQSGRVGLSLRQVRDALSHSPGLRFNRIQNPAGI